MRNGDFWWIERSAARCLLRRSPPYRATERSISLFHFTPARFFELNGRVVDLAPVCLFVLVGNIGPGAKAQRHPIARAKMRRGGEDVIAHALGINEGFQTSALVAPLNRQV